jgi:hypothetical protein
MTLILYEYNFRNIISLHELPSKMTPANNGRNND